MRFGKRLLALHQVRWFDAGRASFPADGSANLNRAAGTHTATPHGHCPAPGRGADASGQTVARYVVRHCEKKLNWPWRARGAPHWWQTAITPTSTADLAGRRVVRKRKRCWRRPCHSPPGELFERIRIRVGAEGENRQLSLALFELPDDILPRLAESVQTHEGDYRLRSKLRVRASHLQM